MAQIEIWIQLENRPWDTMPNNLDRITGKRAGLAPTASAAALAQTITGKAWQDVPITSPGTGTMQTRRMYAPLRDSSGKIIDALIFRRYKAPDPNVANGQPWTVPDDRKVNPWDINEKDPTDTGTMGTIPGPVIECNVGDSVVVHFRNLDMRALNFADPKKSAKARMHSMHVHGFVFLPEHDGAYPLSPADAAQPIPAAERALWDDIGVTGPNKIGDRVPPGATFDYAWKTLGWPSTAGVWLYHDHSICDMANMGLGAIGIVVIHNTSDLSNTANDFTVTDADFPDGSAVGNPVAVVCKSLGPIAIDRSILQKVGILDDFSRELIAPKAGRTMNMGNPRSNATRMKRAMAADRRDASDVFKPDISRLVQLEDAFLHLSKDFKNIIGFCTKSYKQPPAKAQYLQLFHQMTGAPGMCINGRTYLGNTPSVVAGTDTRMRFGVVGMGTSGGIHTFHIHGHRWIVPGPHGNNPVAIQSSLADTPVSQFEDTRIFGPANSFVFTVNGALGSFMRAGGNLSADDSKGEWHMHCHVLDHMMAGMMGSLLIVSPGQGVSLPSGEECPTEDATPAPPAQHEVSINPPSTGFPAGSFGATSLLPVKMGDTVRFTNNDSQVHGVQWLTTGSPANSPVIAAGGGAWPVTMTSMGTFNYQCLIHGSSMPGSITVVM